jgi:hypothetical protein
MNRGSQPDEQGRDQYGFVRAIFSFPPFARFSRHSLFATGIETVSTCERNNAEDHATDHDFQNSFN